MADLNKKNPSVTEDALAIHLDASGNIDRISGHGIAGAGGGGGSMNYYGDDVYIKNTGAAGNIFTLTESVKAKLEQIQPTYTQGTDILVDEYNTIQVNTNGSANSTGMAFVEGINTIASGVASHAEGKLTSAMSDYSHIEGYKNIDYEIPGQIGSNHIEGAYNNVSGVYTHIEGHANGVTGYGLHVQGGYNRFYINNTAADISHSDPTDRWNIWGISIEGMANATTAEPYSGTIGQPDFGYIHGGILKVIGNGTRTKQTEDPSTETITRSDALIIYRDGCISAAGNISANGVELGAGGGTTYQGKNGVNVDGDYIELTTTAYESVTSVPSISNDVNTLKSASGDWNKVSDKLDTTAFSTVSGDFVNKNDLNDYYKKTETSSKEALETAFESKQDNLTQEQLLAISNVSSKLDTTAFSTVSGTFALKSEIPTTVAQLTDSGNYYQKTETSSKTEITNALNTKVDKPTSIQTGKLVYDGDNNEWVTLPEGTTIIVQGQGSVTANYDSQNSTYTVSLLASAENALNKVDDKIDTTAVAQTYQTKADMDDYLTKSEASSTYQPKGSYLVADDITGKLDKSIYANASGNWENASNVVATNSANWNEKVDKGDLDDYLTKAQYGTDSATFALKTQLDDYYKKTDTSSKTELSTEFAKYVTTSTLDTVSSTLNDDIEYVSGQVDNKVDKPTSLSNKYLVLRTDSNGDVSGWCDLQDQSYSKSESQGTFVHRGMLDNGTGGTLTGTGLTGGTVLGVNTDVIQTKLTDEQISAIGEVSSKLDRADLDDYVPYSATELVIGSGNEVDYHYNNVKNNFVQGTNNIVTNNNSETFVQGKANKLFTSQDSLLQGFGNSATNYYCLAQGALNNASTYSLTQGSNNTANSYSQAAGQNNSATTASVAFGNANTAKDYSIAQGTENSAVTTSFAQGSANKARYDSFAQGNRNSAFSQSFAQGSMNYADNHAMAQGGDNTAKYFSQALGFGLSIQGSRGTTDGTDYISGGLAIGTYNQTSAGVAFVVGNGHSNGENVEPTRSDAFVIYPDGRVSAAGNITANGVELGAGGGSLTLPVNVGTGNDVSQTRAIGAIGNNCSAGTKSFAFSYKGATAYDNSFAVNDDNVAGHNSFAWGWANTADNYSMAGGNATSADEHSFALGNAVYTKYWTLGIGRGLEFNGDSNANTGIGALVAGGWNKTSSNAIFVLGNGTGNGSNRSDAVVVDRSGNTKIYGSLTVDVSSGKNVLAVASAATLIGASRQTSANYGVNDTALGTTWLGVGGAGMHQGFIKYSDGGNVGALDTTSTIQLNLKPSTNKFDSIQVQINGGSVGYLIPAVTSTTTAGLTNDGILHIIVES